MQMPSGFVLCTAYLAGSLDSLFLVFFFSLLRPCLYLSICARGLQCISVLVIYRYIDYRRWRFLVVAALSMVRVTVVVMCWWWRSSSVAYMCKRVHGRQRPKPRRR